MKMGQFTHLITYHTRTSNLMLGREKNGKKTKPKKKQAGKKNKKKQALLKASARRLRQSFQVMTH